MHGGCCHGSPIRPAVRTTRASVCQSCTHDRVAGQQFSGACAATKQLASLTQAPCQLLVMHKYQTQTTVYAGHSRDNQ
jgi:hypothetical protein